MSALPRLSTLTIAAVLLAALLVPDALASPVAAPVPQAAELKSPTRVIVRFRSDADASERRSARRAAEADFVEPLPVAGSQLVDPEPGITVAETVAQLEGSPDVLYAEADAIRVATATPNDQFFNDQWGLHSIGQPLLGRAGAPDTDIDAPEAWNLATGTTRVRVGVVDSGIDASHPDLGPNISRTPGGWDWVDNDSVAEDGNGHGTHVAGTIGARGNDGFGVTGVAWQTGLVPLRVLDDDGSGTVTDVADAYRYARDNDVRIVNVSLGGPEFSRYELDALVGAPNVLFVVAAGNEGIDNDETGSYPCNYDLPNVICVAAADRFDALAGLSNYGAGTVDLAAPGVDVLSTFPGSRTRYFSGTSMATPHVAGVAALVWSRRPGSSVADVRAALLGSVDVLPSLRGCVATGGRLNAYRALSGAAQSPPPLPGAACVARTPAGPAPVSSPAPTPLPAITPEPGSDAPVAAALRPASVAGRRGRLVRGRGSLARLFEDDGRRLEVAAQRRAKRRFVAELRTSVRLSGAQRDSLTRLGLGYDGGASRRGVTTRVRVYDWANARWRTVARLRNATRDRTVSWSVSREATRFASSRGVVRVSILAAGKRPFRSRSDRLQVSTR